MNDLIPNVTITGEVNFNGDNIYAPTTDTVQLRKEIGMVFQQPNPFSVLNLWECHLRAAFGRGPR